MLLFLAARPPSYRSRMACFRHRGCRSGASTWRAMTSSSSVAPRLRRIRLPEVESVIAFDAFASSSRSAPSHSRRRDHAADGRRMLANSAGEDEAADAAERRRQGGGLTRHLKGEKVERLRGGGDVRFQQGLNVRRDSRNAKQTGFPVKQALEPLFGIPFSRASDRAGFRGRAPRAVPMTSPSSFASVASSIPTGSRSSARPWTIRWPTAISGAADCPSTHSRMRSTSSATDPGHRSSTRIASRGPEALNEDDLSPRALTAPVSRSAGCASLPARS